MFICLVYMIFLEIDIFNMLFLMIDGGFFLFDYKIYKVKIYVLYVKYINC